MVRIWYKVVNVSLVCRLNKKHVKRIWRMTPENDQNTGKIACLTENTGLFLGVRARVQEFLAGLSQIHQWHNVYLCQWNCMLSNLMVMLLSPESIKYVILHHTWCIWVSDSCKYAHMLICIFKWCPLPPSAEQSPPLKSDSLFSEGAGLYAKWFPQK